MKIYHWSTVWQMLLLVASIWTGFAKVYQIGWSRLTPIISTHDAMLIFLIQSWRRRFKASMHLSRSTEFYKKPKFFSKTSRNALNYTWNRVLEFVWRQSVRHYTIFELKLLFILCLTMVRRNSAMFFLS